MASSITGDLTSTQEEEDPPEVELGIWPIATARETQTDGSREGVTQTPTTLENERSDIEMEEAIWTTGEVLFGNAESADGPTHPFPVSGVVAESTDELMTPPPITIQLERNRPDLSPDWTDEKRTPAGAESMETAELKEFCPLVDCQLDTAEDHLHSSTGSTSQDTGSSDIHIMRNLPDKSTGSRDIQETGSLESPIAERPEAAIIASLVVECTSAHVMIYPNSGSVNPFIIIEDKSRQLPVMDSDATEAPGSLEQGDRGATVTTDIAGAEHMTRTGCQYTQISRTHVEPVSEEVEETSSEDIRTAHDALFPDKSEEDSDDQDSFTKLLAELNLEIEEEVDIELGEELDRKGSGLYPIPVENQEAEVYRMAKEWDVRIDHPTSASGSIECSTDVQPLKFSRNTQEVPDYVAELKPEELTGNIAPDIEHACSTHLKEEEEILYSDIAMPEAENAHTVDNNEVQRTLNLDAIFSFLDLEGNSEMWPVSSTTSRNHDETTARDINPMVTDETFSMRDDDVTNALSHTGNEFTSTPEREIVTLPIGEECFQLGRGDCSPTPTDRKENSEDKLYFHPVRLPCQSDNGDAYLSVESRLSSPQQQRAASPFNSRNAGRRPITRIRRTPISPPSSRMRAFNREFGYKTHKHPISCHQSDIRRWIISDGTKECHPYRPSQYSTGSICDNSLQTEEHLSSTVNLTGARKSTRSDPTVQTILDTSLSNTQKNATFHDVIIASDDNEQQAVRHSPLAADDRRELPDDLQTGTVSRNCCTRNESPKDLCPPLFGHDDRYHYHQTVLPSTRSFLSERRYSDDRHDVGIHQQVVVHSTRLSPFQSDAYGEHCISQACFPADHSHTRIRPEEEQECFQANYNLVTARPEEHSIREAENIHLPPGVERPRQIAEAEPGLEQDVDLNESADLFLEESQWSTNATRGDSILSEHSISRDCTNGTGSPENFVSSLLLLPFPSETRSFDEIHPNREMYG